MKPNSRRTAAFVMMRFLATHDFPANLLPQGDDRAFVQDLVYTAIRRMRTVRRILGELVAKWPKGELEALLYVGAAQVLFMDDVPDFAAVNETVSAAKMCPNPNIARVVNGVLRNLIRRRDEFISLLSAEPLEVRESFPTELVRRWQAQFGTEDAEMLCKLYNTPADTFLARRDGSFTKVERGTAISSIPGYAEGEFIVQDPATGLAISLLGPKPGERILDACAAPGGKAIQIAWRGAEVTACEVNPKRRKRLEENIARTGINAKVIGELPALGSESFDKILVDAPCSNTGTFRRKPDARWNWSAEKLAALVKLQAEILDICCKRLAPGGSLVYSTCSIEPEENRHQVESFLARHREFALDESLESLPTKTGNDGAFAARLTLVG